MGFGAGFPAICVEIYRNARNGSKYGRNRDVDYLRGAGSGAGGHGGEAGGPAAVGIAGEGIGDHHGGDLSGVWYRR